MSEENPLVNLKDIHLPPPVSFWPPAPGWWILALLLISTLFIGGVWLYRKYKKSKPKTEALRILKDLQILYQNSHDELVSLRNLSNLLRRTALTYYDNDTVASLQGSSWLEFLDETGKTKEFSQGAGKVLGNELFQQKVKPDMNALFPLVKKWISSSRHYN
jgi:hypothetical protein|tara:strand:- start:136 stop:618 length:483 start_codon:yes stop_codon:yes gene_type:complete